MPIYEYACLACGEAFERLVPGPASTPATTCPKCASADVARRLSLFGVKSAPPVAGGSPRGSGGSGCCGPGGCGCR